jgi:hypothetical protein
MDQEARLRRREAARRATRRRRRLVLAAVLVSAVLVVLALVGAGSVLDGGEPEPRAGEEASSKPPELPRGGRSIFPERRVIAFYGAPQARALGTLGIGSPQQAARRLGRQARAYSRPDRPSS